MIRRFESNLRRFSDHMKPRRSLRTQAIHESSGPMLCGSGKLPGTTTVCLRGHADGYCGPSVSILCGRRSSPARLRALHRDAQGCYQAQGCYHAQGCHENSGPTLRESRIFPCATTACLARARSWHLWNFWPHAAAFGKLPGATTACQHGHAQGCHGSSGGTLRPPENAPARRWHAWHGHAQGCYGAPS